MNTLEAERTVVATLARLGLADTALGAASETIGRRAQELAPSALLPSIVVDGVGADLIAKAELGRGGMGVVRLAEQRSLVRDVAVKTVLSHDPETEAALVREGRIMGSLEHPNLVPVHALGVDHEGAPILVMKRIEGVSWRALLADPAHAGWGPLLAGHDDRLRANVEVLSQVCRALAFAHDRGVVHRDLKPDNVMIGRFGEVYLLDWGIALRLSDAASEPAGIVGTPAYLSPEMARGDPTLVESRTDVYLLGGTLYEVLTGRVPHQAPTPVAALVSALLGEVPPIASDAPSELATLARTAMAPEPADRVPSAMAFLEGLTRFLASRAADALALEANAAVARAADAIEREGVGSIDAFRALVEARFAYASVHRARPLDEVIRAALDDCVSRLVERELALRSPSGARTFLAELAVPRADLEARVALLEADIMRERSAAESLRETKRNLDSSVGLDAMQRTIRTAAVMSVLILPVFAWESWTRAGPTPIAWAVAGNLSTLAATVLACYVGRRTVLANEATRRVAGYIVMGPFTLCLSNFAGFAVGRTLEDVSIHTAAALTIYTMVGAVTVLRELWPAAVLGLVVIAMMLLFPGQPNLVALFAIPSLLAFLARAIRLEAERSRAANQLTPSSP